MNKEGALYYTEEEMQRVHNDLMSKLLEREKELENEKVLLQEEIRRMIVKTEVKLGYISPLVVTS